MGEHCICICSLDVFSPFESCVGKTWEDLGSCHLYVKTDLRT